MKRDHKKNVNVESFMRDIFSTLRDFGAVLLFLSMTKKIGRFDITGSDICSINVTELIDLGHISYTN